MIDDLLLLVFNSSVVLIMRNVVGLLNFAFIFRLDLLNQKCLIRNMNYTSLEPAVTVILTGLRGVV